MLVNTMSRNIQFFSAPHKQLQEPSDCPQCYMEKILPLDQRLFAAEINVNQVKKNKKSNKKIPLNVLIPVRRWKL